MREEEFESAGNVLKAVFHPGNEKCVVLAHGRGGDKDETRNLFVKTAERLNEEGFSVFRFDFAGRGESQGEMGTANEQAHDLKKALDHVLSKEEIEEAGVLGLSFGACASLKQARKDKRIEALVLWSGFSVPMMLPWPLSVFLDWWSARKLDQPSLFVYGSEDEIVPNKCSKGIYKFASEPKSLVEVEGVGHTFEGNEEKPIDVSLDWFKEHL